MIKSQSGPALVKLCLLMIAVVSFGQTSAQAQDYPLVADVSTLDGIIQAYYEVVSGPAGQPRDWERDRSLHHPQAHVVILGGSEDTGIVPRMMTLAEYHESASGLSDVGFFEYEISREVQRHGPMVHVWSTYEFKSTEDGPVGGRGINSIRLFHDGTRWWITSWMFDGRSDASPVPLEYLSTGEN